MKVKSKLIMKKKIIIKLSEDEALMLKTILGRIGGGTEMKTFVNNLYDDLASINNSNKYNDCIQTSMCLKMD